jgi:hypothetical protein
VTMVCCRVEMLMRSILILLVLSQLGIGDKRSRKAAEGIFQLISFTRGKLRALQMHPISPNGFWE